MGFALILCFLRGPRETGWVGWGGGWKVRRDDPSSSDKVPTDLERDAIEVRSSAQDEASEEQGVATDKTKG